MKYPSMVSYLILNLLLINFIEISPRPVDEDLTINTVYRFIDQHLANKDNLIKRNSFKTGFDKNSLKINEPPPQLISLNEGSSKVLECLASGNPPPKIHWLKNGEKINQNIDELFSTIADEIDYNKDGEIGIGITKSRLYLDCLRRIDTGVYTCVAETPFLRVAANSKVNIVTSKSDFEEELDENFNSDVSNCLIKKSHSLKPRINMWTMSRLEMIGTSKVQLYCRSSNSQNQKVTWKSRSNNQTLTNGNKYQILDNGDLVINQLLWEDMDDYVCQVKNQHGIDEVTSFLYPTSPEKK